MVCANISLIGGVITSWVLEGTMKPLTIVITAFNTAMMLTMYRGELKELIEKIKGNNDDDFGGGSFG